MSRVQKWAEIQEHLRLFGGEIGYLALNVWGSKPARQVGRIDMTEDMLVRWMRKAVEDEDDDSFNMEQGLGRPLTAMASSAPHVFKSTRVGKDDDEDEDDLDPDMDEGDGTNDLDDDEDEDEVEEVEDDEPDRDLAIGNLAAPQVEKAVRHWLLSTLDANTPAEGVGSFRLRFMRHGAHSQLWSVVIDHAPPAMGGAPRSALAGVPSDAPASMPSYQQAPQGYDTSNGNGAGGPSNPFDRMRALMNPTDGSKPPLPAPGLAPMQRQAVSPYVPQRVSPHELSDPLQQRDPPTYEVETLLHLHQISRDLASQAYAQVDRINESYRFTLQQISGIYGDALRHVGGALSDAREHNDGLVNVMHRQKLEEVEKVMESAENADKSRIKIALGREAMQQLGFAARLYAAKRGALSEEIDQTGQGNGHGHVGLDTSTPEDQGEASEGFDMDAEIEDLGDWIGDRPDVVETLNDPAVREYLRDHGNVTTLRELAQMMTSAAPAAPEPEPELTTPGDTPDTETTE